MLSKVLLILGVTTILYTLLGFLLEHALPRNKSKFNWNIFAIEALLFILCILGSIAAKLQGW